MKLTTIAVLAGVCTLLSAVSVLAESPFNATTTMRENLNTLLTGGKIVNVVLKSGATYSAKIGAVGDHLVVLTQPTGKEFYDVVVPIDEIAALEVRARQ